MVAAGISLFVIYLVAFLESKVSDESFASNLLTFKATREID